LSLFAGDPLDPVDPTLGNEDGMGAAARFNGPFGVATDSTGNMYVSDSGNNTIRKVPPEGLVSTVVGQPGLFRFSPGPLPGLLKNPQGVAISGRTLFTTTDNAIVWLVTFRESLPRRRSAAGFDIRDFDLPAESASFSSNQWRRPRPSRSST